MYNQQFYTSAEEVPVPAVRTKGKAKPLTSRLSKSKNFYKEDRELDDYIDRCKLIKSGPKRLLRKMLKLRGREDSNEVKVTASGLSRLLAVNIKSIRAWLIVLEKAGFIYYQGQEWDPHRNYPRKRYIFPETFPGFDYATVFTRKGAKAKFKAKMKDPEKAAKQKAKVAALTKKNTCPKKAGLLDCSSSFGRETWNQSNEDTIVSSQKRIPVSRHGLAAPKPVRLDKVKNKKEKLIVLDHPELHELIKEILKEQRCSSKLPWIARVLKQEIAKNPSMFYPEAKQELAEDLFLHLPMWIEAQRVRTYRVVSLLGFLRRYVNLFCAKYYYGTPEFNGDRGMNRCVRWELQEAFFKRHPYLQHVAGEKTGVQL